MGAWAAGVMRAMLLVVISGFGFLGVDALGRETAFVFSVAVGLVAVACWAVRRLRGGLQRIGEFSASNREGLQFTMRQFMLLTLVVAILISIAKLLQPSIPSGSELIELTTYALTFVLVGLLAAWAMLGSGSPLYRCPVVLAATAASAWILVSVAGPSEWKELLIVKLLEAAWLLGTLWIVRRCGYRLARRTVPKKTATQEPIDPNETTDEEIVKLSIRRCRSAEYSARKRGYFADAK